MSLSKYTIFTLLVISLVHLTGCESEEDAIHRKNREDLAQEFPIQKTRMALISYSNALDNYRLVNRIYPSTEQGLGALVSKPTVAPIPENYPKGGYVKEISKDPWGNDFVYVCPGVHNTDSYDLSSNGPDGKPGTDDDLKNWK